MFVCLSYRLASFVILKCSCLRACNGVRPLYLDPNRMPVIVPVSPVIAAKISLFHVCRISMWVISSAVRLMVMATANFTA